MSVQPELHAYMRDRAWVGIGLHTVASTQGGRRVRSLPEMAAGGVLLHDAGTGGVE